MSSENQIAASSDEYPPLPQAAAAEIEPDGPIPLTFDPTLLRRAQDISFHFFFGAHARADDLEDIRPLIRRCGIYIPEAFGWDYVGLDLSRRIASGDTSALQQLLSDMQPVNKREPSVAADFNEIEFLQAQYELIRGTRKLITFIDVPSGSELWQKTMAHHLRGRSGQAKPSSAEELLRHFREYLVREAQLQLLREQYMLQQLPIRLNELTEQSTRLSRRRSIDVLLQLGLQHTLMSEALRRAGMDVHESKKGYLPAQELVIRLSQLGRDIDVDDDLVAQSLVDSILYFQVLTEEEKSRFSNSFDLSIFQTQISKSFTASDITPLLEILKNGGNPRKFLSEVSGVYQLLGHI